MKNNDRRFGLLRAIALIGCLAANVFPDIPAPKTAGHGVDWVFVGAGIVLALAAAVLAALVGRKLIKRS